MISKIEIKNIASFDATGVIIEDLKKINFIYGANGCGKTTISRCINSPMQYSEKCKITWLNGDVLSAYVYNKDFREQNFRNIPGVFTLGNATITEIANIEAKKNNVADLKTNLNKLEQKREELKGVLKKLKEDFANDCWGSLYKKYEKIFSEEMAPKVKNKFQERLVSTYNLGTFSPKPYDELEKKKIILYKENHTPLDTIGKIDFNEIIELANDSIWNEVIVGKQDVDIAKMISALGSSDWVQEGLKFIKNDSTKCPFCQKETIDSNFKRKLEDYFDTTYVEKNNTIKKMQIKFEDVSNQILNSFRGILSKEESNSLTKLNIEAFKESLNSLKNLFTLARTQIEQKIKEPSRKIELPNIQNLEASINLIISEANEAINEFNGLILNLKKEKDQLKDDVWVLITDEYKNQINSYLTQVNNYNRGITSLELQIQSKENDIRILDEEIKNDTKNITSIEPSVNEINGLLNKYGFTNFKIVPHPTEIGCYQIQREDGSLAEDTLSEGETTFITFLYFYQLIKGGLTEEAASIDRIVVIDDPISSLDSTILFIVSSLIKEIISHIKGDEGRIKQIIVLTHNVYFYKEASFIDCREQGNGVTWHWMLRKNNNITNIKSYGMKNPISNSYELLWNELREENISFTTIQNTMRRILENYFKILGRKKDDDIINSFETAEEKVICKSLLSWINDGSHCLPDDLYIERPESQVNKYKDIFKKIFENMGHIEHYKMMMREE